MAAFEPMYMFAILYIIDDMTMPQTCTTKSIELTPKLDSELAEGNGQIHFFTLSISPYV